MNQEDMDLKWENMLAGIKSQVPFLRSAAPVIYQQIKEKVKLDKLPERVYLTGAGDSWYCGMASSLAFYEWAGIPADVPQSLEFSRYLVKHVPQNSLLVTVSNSGKVSRSIEAVIQAKKAGMYTIACTSNLKEGISQYSDAVIDLAYAEKRFAPGTSSYLASMLVEYCLAIYLAELNGKFTAVQVQEKLAALSAMADGMQKTIDENWDTLKVLGKQARLEDQFIFIGSGPNVGTAYFSMAKMIEAGRVNAVGQELEEWAHEQYFVTHENTYTFLLASRGPSLDRAHEILQTVKDTGSKLVLICDVGDEETAALADSNVLRIYGSEDELLSPLLYCIPAELFAYFFAVPKNLSMLGFASQKVKDVNFRTIYKSSIREE